MLAGDCAWELQVETLRHELATTTAQASPLSALPSPCLLAKAARARRVRYLSSVCTGEKRPAADREGHNASLLDSGSACASSRAPQEGERTRRPRKIQR
ncbi:hypothetical protein L7F22_023471 [Adiantum nelumboides]|nr:hypothetical protein [Adiantum nelumboides]